MNLPICCKCNKSVNMCDCEKPDSPSLPADIIIKLIRQDGKWRVRIGEGAIPQLFDTFDDAIHEIPEYFNNREVC